jgi:hypothetical protein
VNLVTLIGGICVVFAIASANCRIGLVAVASTGVEVAVADVVCLTGLLSSFFTELGKLF